MARRLTDDAVLRLAGLAAQSSAEAMTAFLGQPVDAAEPGLCAAPGDPTSAAAGTGVVFELEGDLAGAVAVLFDKGAHRAALEAMDADPSDAAGRSALRELCNIIASHAVSAVADQLAARVALSVPVLVNDDAGRVLDRLLGRRAGVAVTTTELRRPDGSCSALLVFAPDAD